MLLRRHLQTLCTLLLLVPGWSAAQDRSRAADVRSIELAENYLEALYGADWERLTELTTDDLLFFDQTSAALPGGPWRHEGREAVFDFFRASVATVDSSSFELRSGFRSGDQIVLTLEYVSHGDGAPFGAPGVPLTLRVDAVTVLSVRDDRIARHQDHVDYESLMAQVQEQVNVKATTSNPPKAGGATDGAPTPTPPTNPRFPQPDAERVDSLRAIALRYLDAVWSLDYEAMAQLLAEDTLYEDYTVEYFGGAPYRFEGREAVVEFFRTVNADSATREVTPEVREAFVAGPNVVLLVDITATVGGAAWGVPGRELVGSGLTVTWLRIQDGKVQRHMDFADFDDAIRDFERAAGQP